MPEKEGDVETIYNKGEFVLAVSALASGDVVAVTNEQWSAPDGSTSVVPYLYHALVQLERYDLHRIPRRGWSTLKHPELGLLQWQVSRQPQPCSLALRVDGRHILQAAQHEAQPLVSWNLPQGQLRSWAACAEMLGTL